MYDRCVYIYSQQQEEDVRLLTALLMKLVDVAAVVSSSRACHMC